MIDNYDYRDLAFTNYANVNFALASSRVNGDVYVTGAFNNWNLNQENKMQYDSAQRIYTSRIMLKQGWYDYQYLVKSSDTTLSIILKEVISKQKTITRSLFITDRFNPGLTC